VTSSIRGQARENAVAYCHGIQGWYKDKELIGLWEMCFQAVQHRGIVEVGCFHGRSSSLFAHFAKSRLNPVSLTFIDPFLPWKMTEQQRIMLRVARIFGECELDLSLSCSSRSFLSYGRRVK